MTTKWTFPSENQIMMKIETFTLAGISLLIFLSFLWFLILGGNIPLLGKLFATSAVQDWRVFSIVTLMTWIIVILSFVSFSGSLITGIFLTRTKNKLVVKKVEEEMILINIGSHDEVY